MDKAEKKKILEELGGGISEEIYDDLVQEFISQTRGEITGLNGVLSNDDFDSVVKIAHSIRGSAANLRFTRMQECAKALELAVKKRKDKAPPLKELGGSISPRLRLGEPGPVDKEIIQDCIAKLEEALEDIK